MSRHFVLSHSKNQMLVFFYVCLFFSSSTISFGIYLARQSCINPLILCSLIRRPRASTYLKLMSVVECLWKVKWVINSEMQPASHPEKKWRRRPAGLQRYGCSRVSLSPLHRRLAGSDVQTNSRSVNLSATALNKLLVQHFLVSVFPKLSLISLPNVCAWAKEW